MTLGPVLLAVLALSVVVVAAAFLRGEERRRQDRGQGPRPFRSIGEALRVSRTRPGSRVLVLFAGDDPASVEAAAALASDPAVLRLLEAPDLLHAVVREERQVADVLFAKYAQRPLPPAGPGALLLDQAGQTIAASVEVGPLASWLGPWLSAAGHAALRSDAGPPS